MPKRNASGLVDLAKPAKSFPAMRVGDIVDTSFGRCAVEQGEGDTLILRRLDEREPKRANTRAQRKTRAR